MEPENAITSQTETRYQASFHTACFVMYGLLMSAVDINEQADEIIAILTAIVKRARASPTRG